MSGSPVTILHRFGGNKSGSITSRGVWTSDAGMATYSISYSVNWSTNTVSTSNFTYASLYVIYMG